MGKLDRLKQDIAKGGYGPNRAVDDPDKKSVEPRRRPPLIRPEPTDDSWLKKQVRPATAEIVYQLRADLLPDVEYIVDDQRERIFAELQSSLVLAQAHAEDTVNHAIGRMETSMAATVHDSVEVPLNRLVDKVENTGKGLRAEVEELVDNINAKIKGDLIEKTIKRELISAIKSELNDLTEGVAKKIDTMRASLLSIISVFAVGWAGVRATVGVAHLEAATHGELLRAGFAVTSGLGMLSSLAFLGVLYRWNTHRGDSLWKSVTTSRPSTLASINFVSSST